MVSDQRQNINLKKNIEQKVKIDKFDTSNSFKTVFKNLKTYAETNDKNLLIVINLLAPHILFDNIDSQFKKNLQEYKLFLKKIGISYYDFNDYIYDNYNASSIEQICKKRFIDAKNYYWDHYTQEGYRLLTEKISIKIKNM